VVGNTESKIDLVGQGIKALNDELTMQEVSRSQKAIEVQDARQEYRRILRLHRAREATLRDYSRHAVGCATLGYTAGMFSALLGAAGSAVLLAFSGDRASSLEGELQRKAEVSRELEAQMQKVRNLLEGTQSEEEKLNQMAEVIVIVCRLLRGLCGDILTLLNQFTRLNSTIKQLVADHKETKKIVRDLQRDLRDAEDDGEAEPHMNQLDYDTFCAQLHEMRKLSVGINFMSTLYADVITDVINPGFSRVVEAAYENGGETNVSVVIYNKQSGMDDYLAEAEGICRAREQAADTKLCKRLAEIEAGYASGRARRRDKAKKQAKKANGKGGLFSRIFSRG